MEMVQHIWQNIEAAHKESQARQGEYSAAKLAEMTERPTLTGQGKLEHHVSQWSRQLNTIQANLAERVKQGPVLHSLKQVVGKALAEHRENLAKLQSANAEFREQIESLEGLIPLERHAVEKLRITT